MTRSLFRILGVALFAAGVVAGCDDDNDGDGEGGSGGAASCDQYEFEFEGDPEDGVCPRLECCPGDGQGTFSAVDNGRCLSDANCDAVCEDTDAAFACL